MYEIQIRYLKKLMQSSCPACPVAPADGTGVAPADGTGVAPEYRTGACPGYFMKDEFGRRLTMM